MTSTQTKILKQHNVHIFAVVRVKVSNVQAENHAEAIRKAETMVDLHQMFLGSDSEFADDVDCFLVDDVGDEEFANSRWYGKDGVTPCFRHEEPRNIPEGMPDKPFLKLITLSSGDCGLFLNDRNIMTADPQFEPIDQVETAGFNLANALACEISVINMKTPAKDDWNWNDVLMLHLNPDLNLYRVSYHEEAGDKTILHFDCFATDSEHAMEQAENAYPGSEILHATIFGNAESRQYSLREALEQARAALPDSSFAKQEGIDPDLIHRINKVLASAETDDLQLKKLLIESRKALPIAWENHGGCSNDLLNLIDSVIAD
jgi:hypothetical protein